MGKSHQWNVHSPAQQEVLPDDAASHVSGKKCVGNFFLASRPCRLTLTHMQGGSLKDAMRMMAAERDAGISAAVAQLEAQLFAPRSQIADLQAAAQQVCLPFFCVVTQVSCKAISSVCRWL